MAKRYFMNLFDNIFISMFYTLMFLMIVFPIQYKLAKLIFMFGVMVLGMIYFKRNNHFSLNVIIYLIVWFVYFLLSYVHGIVAGFDFSVGIFQIWFITPLIALIVANYFDEDKKIQCLNKFLLNMTIFVVGYDLLYFCVVVGGVPDNYITDLLYVSDDESLETVDLSSGIVGAAFRIPNQTSLMFMLPYVITYVVNVSNIGVIKKRILISILIIGTLEAFFSSRRALQILIVMGTLIACIINLVINKMRMVDIVNRMLRGISYMGVVVILLVFVAIYNDIDDMLYWFFNSFMEPFKGESYSSYIRHVQMRYLLNNWYDNPLIGMGANSYAIDYVRDGTPQGPTGYEWVYNAWLMQNGLIGIMLFFIAVVIMLMKFWERYKVSNNIIFLSLMVGLLCYVLAGASNPFVTSPWMWIFAAICFVKGKNIAGNSHTDIHNNGERD